MKDHSLQSTLYSSSKWNRLATKKNKDTTISRYLLSKLLRTLSCALFRRLFNIRLTIFLTLSQFDFGRFSAFKHLLASMPVSSNSLSSTMNCFFGKITSFTTFATLALNNTSVSFTKTTDGSELALDVVSVAWLESPPRADFELVDLMIFGKLRAKLSVL